MYALMITYSALSVCKKKKIVFECGSFLTNIKYLLFVVMFKQLNCVAVSRTQKRLNWNMKTFCCKYDRNLIVECFKLIQVGDEMCFRKTVKTLIFYDLIF